MKFSGNDLIYFDVNGGTFEPITNGFSVVVKTVVEKRRFGALNGKKHALTVP